MKRFFCLVGFAGLVFADSTIDWSTLSVRITVPHKSVERQPVNELLAAFLLDALKPVPYDGEMTVEEFWSRNSLAQTRIGKFTVFPKKVRTRYLSDGSAELEYDVPLSGQILDGLVPETGGGKPLAPMCCPVCKRPWPDGETIPPGISLVPKEEEHPIPYTGVLIDARGLGLNPALFPRVVNEEGAEVYGIGFVSKPYAVERGMLSYIFSTQDAYQSERLGMNPLRVTALRVKGRNRTDLVVAGPDAQKLHGSQWNLRLLERCQVVVLTDR